MNAGAAFWRPHRADRVGERLAAAVLALFPVGDPVVGEEGHVGGGVAAGPGGVGPGVKASEAIIENWWRQGMMGEPRPTTTASWPSPRPTSPRISKKISVPVLVMHGDDDQIVPYADSGPLTAKLVQNGTLKTYPGFPHGMPTTQAETINADLLAFIQS